MQINQNLAYCNYAATVLVTFLFSFEFIIEYFNFSSAIQTIRLERKIHMIVQKLWKKLMLLTRITFF